MYPFGATWQDVQFSMEKLPPFLFPTNFFLFFFVFFAKKSLLELNIRYFG
jgi:hypothetical protein